MTDDQTSRSGNRIDPQRMAETTAEFFRSAGDDERLGERLALANTVVHIHFDDSHGVTLMLDRTPIEAEPEITGTAEVELWGSAEMFFDFTMRRRQMAMAVMYGELEYEGPVRKFLRIVPILRSLDFSVWRDFEKGGASTNGAHPPSWGDDED